VGAFFGADQSGVLEANERQQLVVHFQENVLDVEQKKSQSPGREAFSNLLGD